MSSIASFSSLIAAAMVFNPTGLPPNLSMMVCSSLRSISSNPCSSTSSSFNPACATSSVIDRKLLHTIIDKFGGGPVGLNTIAAAISEEKDAIEDIYEPFLIQIGFLDRTPRGRVATPLAYGYFGLAAPDERRRDSRLW